MLSKRFWNLPSKLSAAAHQQWSSVRANTPSVRTRQLARTESAGTPGPPERTCESTCRTKLNFY